MLAPLKVSDDAHPNFRQPVRMYQYVVGEDSKGGSEDKLLDRKYGRGWHIMRLAGSNIDLLADQAIHPKI